MKLFVYLGMQPLVAAFVNRVWKERGYKEWDSLPLTLRRTAAFGVNPACFTEEDCRRLREITSPEKPKREITLSFARELMIRWGISENEEDANEQIKIYKREYDAFLYSDTAAALGIISRRIATSTIYDPQLGITLEPEQAERVIAGELKDEDLPRTETETLVDKAYHLSRIYMELANAEKSTAEVSDRLLEIGRRLT